MLLKISCKKKTMKIHRWNSDLCKLFLHIPPETCGTHRTQQTWKGWSYFSNAQSTTITDHHKPLNYCAPTHQTRYQIQFIKALQVFTSRKASELKVTHLNRPTKKKVVWGPQSASTIFFLFILVVRKLRQRLIVSILEKKIIIPEAEN